MCVSMFYCPCVRATMFSKWRANLMEQRTKLKRVESHFGNSVSWPIPDPPSNIFRFPPDAPWDTHIRMDYFECNMPGTMGYSVATDGTSMFAIYNHRAGETDLSFYNPTYLRHHRNLVWIYMPIDEGEYVTEIRRVWDDLFSGLVDSMEGDVLQFTTNRKRKVIFRRLPGLDGYGTEYICSPSRTGCRIYCNIPNPDPRDPLSGSSIINRLSFIAT